MKKGQTDRKKTFHIKTWPGKIKKNQSDGIESIYQETEVYMMENRK